MDNAFSILIEMPLALDVPLSHQFIFELDDYNKKPAFYKHRFLRQMKECDPESVGILSFISRENKQDMPLHIDEPVPIGRLMELIEYLLMTWESEHGQSS